MFCFSMKTMQFAAFNCSLKSVQEPEVQGALDALVEMRRLRTFHDTKRLEFYIPKITSILN